jgi:hypothetical protein
MVETFIEVQYRWLVKDLKPDTVAYDFGAQTGDSTAYLLQNGVIHVIAYEPDRNFFNVLCEIMKRAKFLSSTTLCNTTAPEPFQKKDAIPESISNKPIIIKCDIEGAEHKVFTKDANLDNVYKLQIEYHGGPKAIPDILKSKGFNVKVDKPWTHDPNLGDVGWIYAWK